MMNLTVFRAALEALADLSRDELIAANLLEADNLATWKQFQDDPFGWFLRLPKDGDDAYATWSLIYGKTSVPARNELPRAALPYVEKMEMLERESRTVAKRSFINPEYWQERAELFKGLIGFVIGAFIDHDARVAELLRANNRLMAEGRRARAALALLDWAFCSAHGRFPLDRITEEQRLWNDAMELARAVIGDDLEGRRLAASLALAAFRQAPAEWWPGLSSRTAPSADHVGPQRGENAA